MNDQQYKHAEQHAEHIHHQIKNLIDQPDSHLGHQLLHQAHQIHTNLRTKQNARSLEQQTKTIMDLLKKIRGDGDQVMDFAHTDLIWKGYEKLRNDLRKFDNF